MSRAVLIGAAVTGLVGIVLFWSFPLLDTGTTTLFYEEGIGFPFAQISIVNLVQDSFRLVSISIGVVLALAILTSFATAMPAWAGRRITVYLLAVLLIGPGLITNTLFKDEFGRPRPSHTVEFGGDKTYVAPGMISDQCPRNCSFTSGDATLGFYLIAFGFAFPGRRREWFTVSLVAGSAIGLLRIAMGGHYLSDVIFSGVTVYAVAAALSMVMLERQARPAPAAATPSVSPSRPE